MLTGLLEAEMKRRNMSVRSAAKEIGVSHTTLNRVLHEETEVDLATVMMIAKWMNLRPAALLGSTADDEIGTLVESIPGLREVLVEAAHLVETGEVSPAVLDDIVSFARYRLMERRPNERREHHPKRAGAVAKS